ncbi:hypothetical protein BGZ52_005199, partial [Haplosporangium bisporale]
MGSCLSSPGLSSGNTAYQSAPPPPAFPIPRSYDLPPGWLCQYDPQSSHLFYINAATGERQWEHPKSASCTANDAAQFREQLNLYQANLQAHYSRYGGSGGMQPNMSQQYNNQYQGRTGYGNPMAGGGGGRSNMGGMAKGGMMGLLAGTLLGGALGSHYNNNNNDNNYNGGGNGANDHSNDNGGGFFGGDDGHGGGSGGNTGGSDTFFGGGGNDYNGGVGGGGGNDYSGGAGG